MSRPVADLLAEHVAQTSHDYTRALQPGRSMSVDYRRQNLRALAEAIHDQACYATPWPIVPAAHRVNVRYYATCVDDPDPAFGRLLIAVRDYRQATGASDRERASDHIVAALDRLVPAEVAA